MGYFEKIDRHAELVRRMGERAGVDLGEALIAGRLSAEAYRSSVFACSQCGRVGACEKLLADGDKAAAPDYCANKSIFDHLSGQ